MNPDCIHYKIFLCAAGYEPEIRRITIDKDICHNYFYLKQKVLAIFPTLKDVAFTISWKDSEGDNIRICTDDELVIALKEMESQEFKKIYVNATPQGKEGPVHPDVICDGCENPLHGFRYKCLVCHDYDLCPDCERSQMHPDHPMIRIPLPLSTEMPFGRRFARDIAKMGRHLERLLHHTADQMGDKKAKGDYSGASRCGGNDNKKQQKTKFCPYNNEMQSFFHNLVYSQLEKMRGSSGGDSNAAPNSTSNNPQPENTEPQASSSTGESPNLEEQKKFVNILTNGLNSFLDPLGIDIVINESKVKEESPQNRPQPNQPENNSGANKTTFSGGSASTTQATSNIAAPIVTQPGMTQTQPSLLINTDPVPPVPVVAPASQPLPNITAPVSVASSSRTQPEASATVVQPAAFTIGVPPPASMVGSQSSVTVGTQPSPSIGFQLPAAIGVPPPMTIGIGTTPSVAIGVQPPPKINVGPQVPVSSPGVPVVTATPVLPNVNPTPQPQVVSPTHSYQDDIPVLDSSWTVVTDGMGESILIQQPSAEAIASSPQNTQETQRIYPELITSSLMNTEEALKIMEQLGFKNEEWLRQLIENKKGNIEEVLNFLSPISKSKPSTNLLP